MTSTLIVSGLYHYYTVHLYDLKKKNHADYTTDFRTFEEKTRLMLQSKRVPTEEWLAQTSRDAERRKKSVTFQSR